ICGNMASAIGPFAVHAGIIQADGPQCVVRIHNTNTGKLIRASFARDPDALEPESLIAIPGVPGRAAPIQLDFLEPGGATTGRLLPTGNALDTLNVPGLGAIRAS